MVRMNFIFILSSDPNLLRKKSVKQKIKNSGLMSHVTIKSVFGVSDQVQHKAGCTATEDGYRGLKFRKYMSRDSTIYVAKTKALSS